MSIVLLVITDGRDDYLARCAATLTNLHGPVIERVMFDDTGDDEYRSRLAARFPQFEHINGGPRQGFGGAIRSAWAQLLTHSTAGHVFHVEQDFVFPTPVCLTTMTMILDTHPHLAQMALRRQPWNDAERAAGGIVEQHPDAYTDCYDYRTDRKWLEHRRFFTTNPCLYRRSLMTVGWPDGGQSEGRFGLGLLDVGTPEVTGDQVRFGFWGSRYDPPNTLHIGHNRAGDGY